MIYYALIGDLYLRVEKTDPTTTIEVAFINACADEMLTLKLGEVFKFSQVRSALVAI